MPIRFRDSAAAAGRVRATLGNASSAFAGTHVAPPSRSGSILTRLSDTTALLTANLTPAAGRTGTIATTLQNFASSEFGTAAPPPIPNKTGTVAATLAGVTCSASGTFTPAATLQDSWWPNWPVMLPIALHGSISQNLLDPTQHDKIADHDLMSFQGSDLTVLSRLANRVSNIQAVHALQAGSAMDTKFFLYQGIQQALKTDADSNLQVQRDFIASATEGNSNWWMRRVSGQQVEAPFNPATLWMCNLARGGGLNSLGETYVQVFWRKWAEILDPSDAAHDLKAELSGFFQDDTHARMQTPMSINNGATVVTDVDLNANGVAESITDFGSGPTAGCRMWCEGHQDSKAAMEANFPGFLWFPNSARFPSDYYDGNGTPPLPMSGHPFYGKLDIGMSESINLAFGLSKTGTPLAYSFTGGGSVQTACRLLAAHQVMLRPDSQNTISGKGCIVAYATTIDRTQVAADYAYARFISVIALLNERVAPSISINGLRPLSLDETLLEFGNPLTVRSMGTLNENTAAFSLRAANFSSGAARFHWAEFEKAIVVARTDSPSVGAYPSADAAVACALPNPGAGKKWQMPNSATYVNPRTGRAMRGQDTALNNGADVTSVSLKPYHAIVVRRV